MNIEMEKCLTQNLETLCKKWVVLIEYTTAIVNSKSVLNTKFAE